MGYVPKSMNPVDLMGERSLHETRCCAACGETLTVAVGVLYEHSYTVNGTPVYGYMFFCSYECLLKIAGEDGHA